jgi:hypothetical protein
MNNIFKSQIEEYFSYYLEELQEAGYVREWFYENDTFELSESVYEPYLQQGKYKVLEKTEHLLHKASITADFTIVWTDKAKNIFYLDKRIPINCNVKDIPFRVNNMDQLISYIEVKGSHEANTSSSVSFPYKQKWLYDKEGIFIQKIKPFAPKSKSGILFQSTFTPKKVIAIERYIRDCKFGRQGDSKLKYDYQTLNQFLYNINNK